MDSKFQQDTQQDFPFPARDVYKALLIAVNKCGMEIKNENSALMRVSLSVGLSWFSWGENVDVFVKPQNEMSCILCIDSQLKVRANKSGSHKHRKNFNKIIEATAAELQV
ncbi:hypothetical protein [Lelliottia wanjuensis]|uniref:hypothetical protein n=1 Tax=Lelliottia wanjuensis TaxID=3050585 RepID=UPI00254CF7D1|nr:hypothetical protein [Lelliottia sp. V106_16]MDK9356725.1 hypothetical protein [Lelliottia sp. V106_16]